MPDRASLASLLETIEAAAVVYDWAAADEAASQSLHFLWGVRPKPDTEAYRLVALLRANRRYGALERVAAALLASGSGEPFAMLGYAQSLLEQGLVTTAVSVLERARATRPLPDFDALIGRAYKQQYLAAAGDDGAAGPTAALDQALVAYRSAAKNMQTDPWPAINIAALGRRACKDRLRLAAPVDVAEELAKVRAIVDATIQSRQADLWTYATATELELATGNPGAALDAAARYVLAAGGDRFAYGSTLRQLREVWQVDESDARVGLVTAVLEAKLLETAGGSIRARKRVAPIANPPDGFEAFFGGAYTSLASYRCGLACADAVARIGDLGQPSIGTGFVMRGESLHGSLGAAPVLVTNAHVLATRDVDLDAVRPTAARISFEDGPNAGISYGIDEVLFSSPRYELDVTVATLRADRPLVTTLREVAEELPRLGPPDEHVRVIGYPAGRSLSYSVDDNLLLDHDGIHVHYRAPTEPGSSGSPVFDRSWKVIALHHRGLNDMPRLRGGAGTYRANEGVSIREIISALRAHIATR